MINIPPAAAWSFALAISASPVFVLIYGPLGLHGSGILTASFLCGTVAAVAIFGSVRHFRLSALDIPFLVFIVSATISSALNPLVADVRELILFAITVSGYFAGRLLTRDHLPILRQACFWLSGLVVVIGTVVTVPFLVSDWVTAGLGRPFVFGFDSATTAFSISLGFLVIALLMSEPNWTSARWLLVIALISTSTAVLAASMVRFSLLAILASSVLCFVLSAHERKFASMLLAVLVASICVGLVARSANAKLYTAYTLEELAGGPLSTGLESWKILRPSYEAERNPRASSPSCQSVNTRNSVAIRKQLLSDAFYLMPHAGLVGFGLMSFGQLACFRGVSPHNDLLQAIVEFGWLGGAAFLAMIALTPVLMLRPARSDRDIRFLFLLCAFMIMLSMIYGHVSRDLSLFMTLGVAVSALSEKRASAGSNCELLQIAESA